jgi:hypothetical protein
MSNSIKVHRISKKKSNKTWQDFYIENKLMLRDIENLNGEIFHVYTVGDSILLKV